MSGSAAPAHGGPPPLAYRHRRVQRLRRLVQRSSTRDAERAFVLEGARLLDEAISAGVALEAVYVAPGADGRPVVARAAAAGIRVFDLAPGVMERVADTVTPQPVLAVCGYVDRPLDDVLGVSGEAPLLVVCIDVRDPGNLGTVLRSAEAAGAGGVICCQGTVDVYNPKCVRASAGSLFHVPVVVRGEPVEVLQGLGAQGVCRLGTRPSGGMPYYHADFRRPTAIVVGNEGAGLDQRLDEELDTVVSIPMAGRAESLNVGMTAAILCFEAARQRR